MSDGFCIVKLISDKLIHRMFSDKKRNDPDILNI